MDSSHVHAETAEHRKSALQTYSDYLGAVLAEGDGRITAEQYSSLEALRKRHDITPSEHEGALRKHQWTVERFAAAGLLLPSEYVTFLKAILVDGVIDERESKTLGELKAKHKLSDADHLRALHEAGAD